MLSTFPCAARATGFQAISKLFGYLVFQTRNTLKNREFPENHFRAFRVFRGFEIILFVFYRRQSFGIIVPLFFKDRL